MSHYGCTVTKVGRELLARLMATKQPLFITKVMVGSGKCPDETFPSDLTSLIQPVAQGTSTVPIYSGDTISMTVEYRSDLNGGLQQGFWLNEFCIQAQNPDGDEIMLFYGTLGDYPVWVSPFVNGTVDVRRFPVSITIGEGAEVQVDYNPGSFMTAEDARTLINGELKTALQNFANSIISEITIPANGWSKQDGGGLDLDEFGYFIDVQMSSATTERYPNVALHKASLETAEIAELCPTVQAMNGKLRLWAKKIPKADMNATVALLGGSGGGGLYALPIATAETLGGVKIGGGINVTDDGTISSSGEVNPSNYATSDEVGELLDEIFAQ